MNKRYLVSYYCNGHHSRDVHRAIVEMDLSQMGSLVGDEMDEMDWLDMQINNLPGRNPTMLAFSELEEA